MRGVILRVRLVHQRPLLGVERAELLMKLRRLLKLLLGQDPTNLDRHAQAPGFDLAAQLGCLLLERGELRGVDRAAAGKLIGDLPMKRAQLLHRGLELGEAGMGDLMDLRLLRVRKRDAMEEAEPATAHAAAMVKSTAARTAILGHGGNRDERRAECGRR